ncbi:MAG: M56 family metallopeptidase [Dehalococcoidia bacterium]
MMRRIDSFVALILLTGAVLGGLSLLVVLNGPGVVQALAASAMSVPYQLIHACLLLFSLGPLQPELIVIWLLLLAALFWLSGRLLWEVSSRGLRTRHAVSSLRRASLASVPCELAQQCEELGLSGRVEFVALPTAVAVCHGFRTPRILLSSGLLARLTGAELEAVLLHERLHLRRRDPLRLLIAQSLAATFRPLSLASALAQRLALEQEVLADRAAAQAQGNVHYLASALLSLLYAAGHDASLSGLAVSGLSATAARVEALVDPTASAQNLKLPAGSVRRGIAFLAAGATVAVAFTLSVQAGHLVFHCSAATNAMRPCLG